MFPALNYGKRKGIDMDSFLRRVNLPADVFAEPQQFYPATTWPAIFEELKEETGHADIGWQVSLDDPLRSYPGEFNEFAMAPTLLEAVRHIARANQRFSNNQHIWLRFTRDNLYMCHFDEDRRPGYDQRTAFRTGIGMLVIRTFLGPHWCPRLILTETPLDAMPDRELIDGACIRRWRHFGAIQVPRMLLSVPSRNKISRGYPTNESPATTLPSQIRQIMRSYIGQSMVNHEQLAELLYVSPRTLQRRLGEYCTSYSALLRTARFDAARDLLADRSLRIIDTCAELGFDDQSHFTRFFRHASGVTPNEYRRSLELGLYALDNVH